MRRTLAIVVFCCAVPAARADERLMPDGTAMRYYGGLHIYRQGDQTVSSVGGVFFPRKVRVDTATPQGTAVIRFSFPSAFKSPTTPDWIGAAAAARPDAPAWLRVSIPDPDAILYVEGDRVRHEAGALLESPPLPHGRPCPVRLRAVFAVGDKVIVEDRVIELRAGENAAVTFDGSQAVASVPLSKGGASNE